MRSFTVLLALGGVLILPRVAMPEEEEWPQVVMRPFLSLPQLLEEHIERSHPELRVPGPRDMKQGWDEREGEQGVPYAGWGDFDGNRLTDVAMLLLGSNAWKLYAFHQVEPGAYRSIQLDNFPGPNVAFWRRPPQHFSVEVLPAGKLIMSGEEVLDPGSRRNTDTILFRLVKDSKSLIRYRWISKPGADAAKPGGYAAAGYGELTD